jgi:acyl-CoA synthetase (NDP forming)
VAGFEAWFDSLMGFAMLSQKLGDRIAIVSGPGGLAVSAAEACEENGLRLAQLSPKTRDALAEVVPPTGTSLRNPIDVGLTASLDIGIYIQSVKAVVADPAVDAVLIIGAGLSPEANRLYTDAVVETRRQSGKAILMVNIPGFDPSYIPQFCDAGIPYFESSERALRTYASVLRYQDWRKKNK